MDFSKNSKILFMCSLNDNTGCERACMDRRSVCENLRVRVDVIVTVFEGSIV